jgi:hypothetical protein
MRFPAVAAWGVNPQNTATPSGAKPPLRQVSSRSLGPVGESPCGPGREGEAAGLALGNSRGCYADVFIRPSLVRLGKRNEVDVTGVHNKGS